ncbi:MAG: hypothetical protein EOO10_23300 [Chitinophagaceae bacterium]|nr:MAG: hypothetical protein EOO10_23300 [Chitinophagaceae bacterium]
MDPQPENFTVFKVRHPENFHKYRKAEIKQKARAEQKNGVSEKWACILEKKPVDTAGTEQQRNNRIANEEVGRKKRKGSKQPFSGPPAKKKDRQPGGGLTFDGFPTPELPAKKQRFGKQKYIKKDNGQIMEVEQQNADALVEEPRPNKVKKRPEGWINFAETDPADQGANTNGKT